MNEADGINAPNSPGHARGKLRFIRTITIYLFALCGCDRQATPPTSPNGGGGDAKTQAAIDPASSTGALGLNAEQVAINNRAVGLMGKFEYEPARALFQQLVDQQPTSSDLRVNLAIATLNRQREGDEEAALAILENVLQDEPTHLRANYTTGLLKLYLQSPAESIGYYQKVADADARDAYAAYYVGQCLAQMRQYQMAVEWFQKSVEIDPYLRSGYYAAAQALRGLGGRDEEAAAMLEAFQKLERNPRARLVEFKYTRMGRKGEAMALGVNEATPTAKPEGALFADPVPLVEGGEQYAWKTHRPDRPVSITACDLDMDGDIDIFIANCLDEGNVRNAVCINNGSDGEAGRSTLDLEHPLAKVTDVNAALWGDYDNDGLTDVYLCRRGGNQLWKQQKSPTEPDASPLSLREGEGRGEGAAQQSALDSSMTSQPSPPAPLTSGKGEGSGWLDVTKSTGVANGEFDSVDGAIFDADHDGDLDLFVVNADGPNELFNNNLDGTFRPIAQERGIAGAGNGSRQMLPVDLDSDRDVDIIVINNQPPHDVWVNDRLWAYHQATEQSHSEWVNRSLLTLVALDQNADGSLELQASAPGEFFAIEAVEGVWKPRTLVSTLSAPKPSVKFHQTAAVDFDGTGIGPFFQGPRSRPIDSPYSIDAPDLIASTGIVQLSLSSGPSTVQMPADEPPTIHRPGPGRHKFATIQFTGREISQGASSSRSNASGIGVHYAARVGSNWVTGSTLRTSSGPGQSLQPVAIGLNGHDKIDFISIDWSDGVFQSEVDLAAGKLHVIEETQRQLSSCPVIFAWNGIKHEFITDCLGVGGIGYAAGPPGEYAPSRPWENVLLPVDSLQPKNGRFEIKLSEPMEEACYLDTARLVAYDLPPGWQMTADDRMSILGPEPTGAAVFYESEALPTSAINDRGADVTEALRHVDLVAAPVGVVDYRFIGRLIAQHVLTLAFSESGEESQPILIIDGWVEYPYSQTMFAAWQAGATYEAPTIEARGDDGQWHVVLEQFGYPAGMPRQMSVPLPIDKLPKGWRELRIRTNQEIYFDRIALAWAKPNDQVRRAELAMTDARLAQTGFAKRTTGPQRQPYYDYNQRTPFWDCRYQKGFYTEVGPVKELIDRTDDAVAIFGQGEEIHVEFDAALPSLHAGWTRRFVLELNGWCKDMDLFTKDGETIEPLPARDPSVVNPSRDDLHRQFNTRFEFGR